MVTAAALAASSVSVSVSVDFFTRFLTKSQVAGSSGPRAECKGNDMRLSSGQSYLRQPVGCSVESTPSTSRDEIQANTTRN